MRGYVARKEGCITGMSQTGVPQDRLGARQACSSVAERCHNMAEVGGSTPSAPTNCGATPACFMVLLHADAVWLMCSAATTGVTPAAYLLHCS